MLQDFVTQDKKGGLHFGGARMALLDIEAGYWGLRRQIEALVGRRLANAVLQQAGTNGGASFARAFTANAATETDADSAVTLLRDCIAAYRAAGFGDFSLDEVAWPIGRITVRATNTFETWMMQQHQQSSDCPICAYSAGVLVGFINAIADRRDIVCIEQSCQACGDDACIFELIPATEASETAVVAFDPDPFLSQQLNLLDILFDRMPMGIAIFDRDLRIRRFNPTWASFIDRYTVAQAADVLPGVHFFDLLPDVKEAILPLLQRVLAGETVQQTALPSTSGGVTSYWDVTFTPLVENGEVVGILDVVIDATERQQMVSKLQQSEANLHSMLESAKGYAIYRVAVDPQNPYLGRVVLVSPSIRDVIGIDDPYRFEAWFEPIHPEDVERVTAANQRAFDEGIPFDETMRFFDHRSQSWRWVHTVSNPVFDRQGRLTHFNGIVIDVTDQKRAEETLAHVNVMLEQKVDERTQKLSTLLEVSQNVASTLALDPLLGLVLDQLRAVVAYDGASILELQDEALHLLAYRGPIPHQSARQLVFPLAQAGANRSVIQQQQPIMIADVLDDDDPHARAFRQTAASELDTTFGYVRSWMGVPLILRGNVLGMISLDHSQPDFYSEESAQLAQAFAGQVAVFIENARLYENEQERRAVAEGLSDIVRILNSSRPLSEILDYIVVQASQLMGAAVCTLHHIDYEEAFVRIEASHGLPPTVQDIKGFPLLSTQADARILKREPVVSSRSTPPRLDPAVESRLDERVRRWRAALGATCPAFLAAPLVVADEVYGSLAFYFDEPQTFDEETIALAMSLGEQAALAIDNASLRRQAEQAAVAAERNRLARELHDAVTQTLFSASLIAEVLPRLWEKDETQGRARLTELRELTRGALAEMRTLLLELRPATLTESSLAELLRQLTEAIIGRSRLPVELKIEGERPLPPEIQVALYRIAQEALNNVVKHAHASAVKVTLIFSNDKVTLTVADDGRGFAVDDVGVQSLGLSIMRERAEKIGATLTLDSRPEQGTTIQVRV